SEFQVEVRRIDQKMFVTNAALVQVPFDLDHWQKVAAEWYPNGLPEPHADDPMQWLFKGNIAGSMDPLQVAVGRLLGYRWPEQGADNLDSYADEDGIVCLPAVRGEQPAAERLRSLLTAAYGDTWSATMQDELLAAVGYGGKGLDAWLRDGFWPQHCARFHNRPFIWHLWDGRRDGFAALVNYHMLDRQKLEKLAYTYLGDWLTRQRAAMEANEPGADLRVAAAEELQRKLALILDGEPPFDIYVRWKPLHTQPIGWEPDLNDGVRLNIRPFVAAGVLRGRFTINWNKDRGTDPPSAPNGPERHNDRHLTRAEKEAARRQAGAGVTA
ncbi:MAG: SAM-dependent DNA methyltransferase, partial [Solirubrobacteraceae bacterium]